MKRAYRTSHSPIGNTLRKVTCHAVTYFEVSVSVRMNPQTIPANNSDEVGRYLSSSCCAVSSAPVFLLLLYGGFLEDIGAEVEVTRDDQYQFLSVYICHKVA